MNAMYVTTSLLVSNWPELSESKVVLAQGRPGWLVCWLLAWVGWSVLALGVLTVVVF